MKYSVMIIIVFYFFNGYSQLAFPDELKRELSGKSNYYEIQNIVTNYFERKINETPPAKSISIKKLKKQYKKWNRLLWWSGCYTDNEGMPGNVSKINYDGAQQVLRDKVSSRNQPQNWMLQGPYNSDDGIARFDVIAFHPSNANIIFAGSPYGGLFKTTDGGNSWTAISSLLPSLGIAGISIDYTNPDIIYVMTGDRNNGSGCFPGYCLSLGEMISASQGVFKSYNGGITWAKTGSMASGIFEGRGLVMSPSNPGVLIAYTNEGIFRTTNGGITWNFIIGGSFYDIKYKPDDANILYAAGSQFFKSINGGASFDNFPVNGMAPTNRISIAVTPVNPNKVLLVAGPFSANQMFYNGLFQSTDAGSNFTMISNFPNLFSSQIGSAVFNDQSDYDIDIAISNVDENDIYVGGLCVWRSTTGGAFWFQASAYWPGDTPFMHPDIHHIAINPLNNHLWCANDGGVYFFNGTEWIPKFNGLSATQFYHFERENDEGDIWGGAQDNGILEQNGSNVYYQYFTGDGFDMMTDHSYLVADGEGDDVYFSVNDGIYKDCAGTTCDISVVGNTDFFAALAMSPLLEDKIYAGYQSGVFRSIDAGENWAQIGSNAPGNWAISTCNSNDGILYAAGNNSNFPGGIRRYHLSSNWVNITPPLPYNSNLRISDIDVHPFNHDLLYISVAGTDPSAKVFSSNNGGNSWDNFTFNLPNVPILCIKKDDNNGLYVGTTIGVFYKRNNVNHWEHFSNGLPQVPVTEIELSTLNNQIWISTFGRGIWYTTQYNNCPVSDALSGEISGRQYKEASLQLTSSQLISGTVGTYVKYNSGNKIVLTDGFKASLGSKFRTYLSGCGGEVNE